MGDRPVCTPHKVLDRLEHMWHCSAGSENISKTKVLQQFMVYCLPPALASFSPPNALALALALAMQGGHDSEDIKESTM